MIILPETSAAGTLICKPDFHRTTGRERGFRGIELAIRNEIGYLPRR